MTETNLNNILIGGIHESGESLRTKHENAINAIISPISTSFGPLGLDKMCIDSVGEVKITNDGATILQSMEIDEPVAKMMVDLAKQQDNEMGDGTTSVVLLAASLIEKGHQVIKRGIHPNVLIAGYKMAFRESVGFFKKNLQIETNKLGKEILKSVVETSIASKVIKAETEHFGKLIVEAARAVHFDNKCMTESINVLKKQGGAMKDSYFVNGFALNCSLASNLMPRKIKTPRIICIDFSLQKMRMRLGIQVVATPDKLEEIRIREAEIVRERVKKIITSGVNVILSSSSIDDMVIKQLVDAKVIGIRRVKSEDLHVIATATGTTVYSSMSDLDGNDNITNVGVADSIYVEQCGDNEVVIINGIKKNMGSIILRGANEQLLDEMERSVHDALCAIKRTLESKTIVPGGGAVETALSVHLDHFSNTICSKDQIGIYKYSEALLTIPKTLAVNAGLNSNEIVAKLFKIHSKNKEHKFGVNVNTGNLQDNIKAGIIEPGICKLKALRSATEAAIAVLRIDEAILLPPENK